MTQIIDTTAGDTDYVTARVTDRSGKSLAATTFEVALGGYTEAERPTTWKPADLVERPSASVALVSLLVDASTEKGTGLYLWVRPADTPTKRAVPVRSEAIDVL